MPEPGATSDRLEVLKARWEADRGSRVFLQLADEYRRLGRIEEAAQVLEQGLEATPGHTAALVALGRCRLELGRTDSAVATLEAVLEGDPTQMVAYRLLVEAYLAQGKAEEARERLRFYTLLNDADPEIAELRRRIGELDRGGRRAAPPAEAAQEEIRDEASEEPREEPRERAAEPSRGGLEAGGAGGGEPPSPPSPSDPFPDLSDTQYRRRFDESAGGEDLFGGQRSAPEREEPAEPPAPGPPAQAPSMEEGHEEPESAREEGAAAPATGTAGGNLFELPPPPPPPSQDLGELLGGDGEAAVEREPGAAEPAEAAPDGSAADRSTEPPPDPGEPPPPPPTAPTAGGDEAPRPTVTLGRLYLRQGHATEAEGIFRAVLERDPDNQEARRHLEELAREQAPALGAAELLEGYPAGERDGLTERKRHVLERYLERFRGRSAHDVR